MTNIYKNWLIIIAIAILFNTCLGIFFIYEFKEQQENIALYFENKMQSKYTDVLYLMKQIHSYLSINRLDKVSDFTEYFEVFKNNLADNRSSFTNILILDKNGKVIYSTLPYNIDQDYSLANTPYFTKTIQGHNLVYAGNLFPGSKPPAILYGKVINYNDSIYGAMIVEFDINGYINSLEFSKLFNIIPINNNSLKPASLFNLFNPIHKNINNTAFEIVLSSKLQLAKAIIIKFAPWEITFLLIIITWRQLRYVQRRFFSIIYRILRHSKNVIIDPFLFMRSTTNTSEFLTVIAKILGDAAIRIKEYDSDIAALEDTIFDIMQEVTINEEEINQLSHELINLIHDESIHINDEYVMMLLEFKRSSNYNIKYMKELLLTIKNTINEIKVGRIEIDFSEIIELLYKHFKVQISEKEKNVKAKVFKAISKSIMDLIDKYFIQMCVLNKSQVAIHISPEKQSINFMFEGELKVADTISEKTTMNSVVVLQKIKFLVQVNRYKIDVRDTKDKLIIKLDMLNILLHH